MQIISKTILFSLWMFSLSLSGQQLVDSNFFGKIDRPAYNRSKGPKVLLDIAHHNGGYLQPSFQVLSNVLRKDGYDINVIDTEIFKAKIKNYDILVIIDPLAIDNIDRWELPTQSALRSREIKSIHKFVKKGGSLLLVADHMPFAGASQKLAASFGVNFINGFIIDTLLWDLTKFNRKAGSLIQHPIIDGRNNKENIFEVASYFGQGFTSSNSKLRPFLVCNNDDAVCYEPQKAWRFDSETRTRSAFGLYQGIAGEYGKGKIVILGDSSFVGAYLIGPNKRKVGMNSIEVKDNFQFVLNIFHWLSNLY